LLHEHVPPLGVVRSRCVRDVRRAHDPTWIDRLSEDHQRLPASYADATAASRSRRAGKPHRQPIDDDTGDTTTRTVIAGFRVATVFDITQTEGGPLPAPAAPALIDGHAPANLLERLAAQITAQGFTYQRAPLPKHYAGANGLTDYETHAVTVRPDLPDAHAAKTTAHELAHVLLHHPITGIRSRSDAEVEAESVAYIVCRAAVANLRRRTRPALPPARRAAAQLAPPTTAVRQHGSGGDTVANVRRRTSGQHLGQHHGSLLRGSNASSCRSVLG
jgi:hypothetical protein